MIVSHEHKFIFLKTNKTAGTSIEIALSKFCGPDDIITRISKEDEALRKSLGYPGPRHFRAKLSDYNAHDWKRLLLKGRRKVQFVNHSPAVDVKKYLGDDVWNSYYKFCFERNPWDRVISLYYYQYSTEPRPNITEFLDSEAPLILKQRGYDLYTIDGKIAVDKICRFENLKQELEVVREHLGLPEALDLPRAKSKFRKDKRNYQDILNDEQRAKIAKLFSEEIALLGYEF